MQGGVEIRFAHLEMDDVKPAASISQAFSRTSMTIKELISSVRLATMGEPFPPPFRAMTGVQRAGGPCY
jgi:hypothetical protein